MIETMKNTWLNKLTIYFCGYPGINFLPFVLNLSKDLLRASFMYTKRTVLWLYITFMAISLTGCSFKPNISGFRPIYPALVYSLTDLIVWTEVNSLTPRLHWQPYPGEHQTIQGTEITPFITLDLGEISDKQYDLKLWEVNDQLLPILVYEVESLSQPQHTVGKALKPGTKYLWSVRARYKTNGETRLSEWSLSQLPCPPPYGFKCAREFSRQIGYIPPLNYYRFKTP